MNNKILSLRLNNKIFITIKIEKFCQKEQIHLNYQKNLYKDF